MNATVSGMAKPYNIPINTSSWLPIVQDTIKDEELMQDIRHAGMLRSSQTIKATNRSAISYLTNYEHYLFL
jgi:hypothetical protein